MDKETATPKEYNPDVCNYKHELVSKDINNLNQKFDENITSLKEMIKENKDNDKEQNKKIMNKLQVSQESINVKLETFDEAFRGNGKIGVFEQLRDVKKDINNIDDKIDKNIKSIDIKLRIIFFMLILLLGGRVLGFSVDTIKEWFFPPKQIQQVRIESINEEDYIIKDIKEE